MYAFIILVSLIQKLKIIKLKNINNDKEYNQLSLRRKFSTMIGYFKQN